MLPSTTVFVIKFGTVSLPSQCIQNKLHYKFRKLPNSLSRLKNNLNLSENNIYESDT